MILARSDGNSIYGDSTFPLKSRPVHRMDLAAFEGAVRSSTLFTDPANTVDGYANQLEREVTAVLDRLAPMRSGRRRPAKPITRWLSDEALAAKRRRRHLERRWRKKRWEADRVAYRNQCRHTNWLINKSRSDFYRTQLSESVNCRERWRTTNKLLHAHERVDTRTENANAKLCERFSRFFVAKIALLKQAVAGSLSYWSPHNILPAGSLR